MVEVESRDGVELFLNPRKIASMTRNLSINDWTDAKSMSSQCLTDAKSMSGVMTDTKSKPRLSCGGEVQGSRNDGLFRCKCRCS